ncbi:MAG: esterase family protein [Bacteroides sp.]|nr:esterase family protein [Bacteroides sp.]
MKSMRFLFSFLLLLAVISGRAARVDTVLVKSPSMSKEVKVVYVLPERAIAGKPQACPVVYLLHGYGGNAKTWIGTKPELPEIADAKGIIFVCPDGKNSWYWDSPKNPSYRYETFISSELVNYTDTHYATIPDKGARAITGLSMGGHGALWNAIRHKDVFGAAGSTSGGVDIRPFPQNWEMKTQLGEFAANKSVWDAHTVINQIDKIENGGLALIIDCGESDFFLDVNKELHQRLLANKIDHDFITRPGAHNGKYWNNSIDYQILFFSKFFAKKK